MLSDLTTGSHFYSPASTRGFISASLNLTQAFPPNNSAYFSADTQWSNSPQQSAAAGLWWTYQANVKLSSVDLADVQLNRYPLVWSQFNYDYESTSGNGFAVLYVQPDPLAISTVPEPGSLGLCVSVQLGLAVGGIRRRFVRAG